MQAKLMCKTGQLAGKEFLINNEATIGKHPTSDCVLDADIISGQHARIYYDDREGSFFVEDLNSRNGTRVDGAPVKFKEKLSDLNVITFAHKYDFIFQKLKSGSEKTAAKTSQKTEPVSDQTMLDQEVFISPPTGEPAGASADLGKTMFDQDVVAPPDFSAPDDAQRTRIDQDFVATPAFPAAEQSQPLKEPRFALHIVGANKTVELKLGENIVGRTEECDVVLDEPSISRKHAVIRLQAGKVFVKDAGSKNKTFVNNEKIEREVEAPPAAAIRFGAVETRLMKK
jgi:pSer/pThr/pTyr-binding forkhead associated (FHA) protein